MNRFYGGRLEPLGEREVGVIAATAKLAGDGHIIEPAGIDLARYCVNPIILWSHIPTSPIGVTTAIGINTDGNLGARIAFAPPGISLMADQVCALVKAGILQGVSIGFEMIESTPLDRNQPHGGQYISRSELLEISVVSIPADVGARVIERTAAASSFRRLPPLPQRFVQRAFDKLPGGHNAGSPPFHPAIETWLLMMQTQREREEYERRMSFQGRQRRLQQVLDSVHD